MSSSITSPVPPPPQVCNCTIEMLRTEYHELKLSDYCPECESAGIKVRISFHRSQSIPVTTAGPALPSSPNSKSSDGSGEFFLKIHSPDIDGRTINIEVINRNTSGTSKSQQRRVYSSNGNAEINARLQNLETQLETGRKQREALETELKQVMAQLHQKEQTVASAQGATTASSLISRFRAAWRSSSHLGSSHTRYASSPTSIVPSEAATTASSTLSVSSLPTTPPHPRTASTFSSPLSPQPMSPGTTVTASPSSPHCPVCHEPIDDDLYEMVECKHLFHLTCARFVWNRQHRREETPYCVFPGCDEPVKHSPTKRLARIIEESSSRSDSDISDPSHRSIGQTNPSFDRQSIGSQDTVVSQAITASTSTESNPPQPQLQPQTNMTPNTVPFSSSSSSSSNSASTSTSASTQEHKQPPTMVGSTGSAPASSSDA